MTVTERPGFDLDGRVAVVTGGGRGIGRGYVDALARHRAAVVVADVDSDAAGAAVDELCSRGARAAAATTDVTDEASVQALMAFAAQRFGSLDIVVCNAGGAKAISPRAAFHEISVELWEQVVALNLRSAWLCAKHAFPLMQAHGRGRIVMVSSASATTAQPLGITPYIAAKGGIEALTRALAREAGPHGITVNAVAPGFTPVESVRALHGERLNDLQGGIVGQQARPVVGTIEDVAAAVVFLSSDEAQHVTGQVLHVDGGWAMA